MNIVRDLYIMDFVTFEEQNAISEIIFRTNNGKIFTWSAENKNDNVIVSALDNSGYSTIDDWLDDVAENPDGVWDVNFGEVILEDIDGRLEATVIFDFGYDDM